ncbi:protein FAM50A-like, partial [Chamaea fasciata]|uniref:protein FAM50A-like n=1 Tax=Chamaea fasciata TaxID=190680 RepID=UPI00336A3C6F
EEENRLREGAQAGVGGQAGEDQKREIEITFSYWDGSGHRRTVKWGPEGIWGSPAELWGPLGPVFASPDEEGNTMQQFLQKALEILRKDFSELRSAGVEQLMYIKEDLIIPHHHSFYDFIVTKARGKSGPLFNFDVHDDVRLLSDATVEKDESHAGKVVLRSWYEKNKTHLPGQPLGALRPRETLGQVHDPLKPKDPETPPGWGEGWARPSPLPPTFPSPPIKTIRVHVWGRGFTQTGGAEGA